MVRRQLALDHTKQAASRWVSAGMRPLRWFVAGVAALSMPCASAYAGGDPLAAPAAAPETASTLRWDPAWARFRPWEYAASLGLAVSALPALMVSSPESPWTGRNGFDEEARDALRFGTLEARHTARDASDFLLALMVNQPLLVDALVITAWYHRSGDTAWQMTMIDLEAFAFTGAVNAWVSSLAGRERPYGRECPADAAQQNRDCSDTRRYRSFFSGHTSTAFTSAGLLCSHHAHLPLYGGGAADALACAAGLGAAATTGLLRAVSDQHYMTDVIAGASLGLLSGLGLPHLLHYGFGAAKRPASRAGASIGFVPAPQGGYVVGSF